MARDHNTRVKIVEDRSPTTVEGVTQFGQFKVAQKEPQLVLNSDLPLSERRDDITETNGATVTKVNAEYRLRASTTSGSNALLRSRQRGNYLSGSVFEPGIGIRVPTQPTGDAFIRWGYFNSNDGIFFEYDADGMYVVVRKGGEDTRVHRGQWNRDTIDGSGGKSNPSSINFDPADGAIYQMPFAYYGYGAVTFEISASGGDNNHRMVTVHSVKMDGETSIDEPNLPISCEVDSGTTGTQLDAFVGGRQMSPLGGNDNTARSVAAYRTALTVSAGTSFRPLISFRHKSGYENIPVRLSGITVISDADIILEIHRNATLDGTNFVTPGNHVADETATEWDISSTATYTSGESIYDTLVDGGTGQATATSAELPQRPISELDTITVATRRVSGTSNYTVDALFRVKEDW